MYVTEIKRLREGLAIRPGTPPIIYDKHIRVSNAEK
jgi:hypothetical protein